MKSAAKASRKNGATHPELEASKGFSPIDRSDARLLILGSLPGQKSLAEQQYYAHPRNTFWRIMEELFGVRGSYADRCAGLIQNSIALWDVLGESKRPGSLDADIRIATAKANDFSQFLQLHPSMRLIAFNGKKAEQLFGRLVRLRSNCHVEFIGLPSTSPAFATLSTTAKIDAWREGLSISQTLKFAQNGPHSHR